MVSYIRNGEVDVRVTIPVTRLFDLTKHLLELELELLVLIRQHRLMSIGRKFPWLVVLVDLPVTLNFRRILQDRVCP